MRYKDLSLGKKISIAGYIFLMPIAAVVFFNIYRVWAMQQLYLSLDEVYRTMSTKAANAHSYFLTASLESDNQKVVSLIAQADKNINEIQGLSTKTEILSQEIISAAHTLVSTYNSTGKDAAKLAELSLNLENICLSSIENKIQEVCEWVEGSNMEQVIGYSLCISIGLTILLTIVGKIIGPINETITHTSEVTNGNLTVKLQESDSKDEVGRLRSSVAHLTTFLQDTFGSIGHEVSNITEASSEFEKSAQAIRTQATYISDSTNEVSAAIEELAASVEQNSQNSISGAQMAESALSSVSECNDSAMKTVAAMNEITDRISIINSIAFQTNILALNAAVEAARAGDAGKGFSVVASDIRKLAERSALAAKEINTVSTSASNAAKSAQEVFTKVLPEINKTSELIREISSSSLEQAQSGARINTAVQDFTQVTRHFTGIADEVAQNSAILFQRSEELSSAISYFKTE
ncbi:MAG: hypothetical protein II937_09170 [Bacteroidales bacterium]|nr:hypothetical protein [Bacteroidales bacterium]